MVVNHIIYIFSMTLAASLFVDVTYATTQGKENALWAQSIFFRGFDPTTKQNLSDKQINEFASRLKAGKVRYAYLFAGPYQQDGHLPQYPFSTVAKNSIEQLKKIYPSLKILPWIGGIQNKTVYLESEKWLNNSIQDTAKLVNTMPVDGIHIDLEYVLYPRRTGQSLKREQDFGKNWVRFHERLRAALPKAFISTVTVASVSQSHPWKHKHSFSEIRATSSLVDQFVFMFYETNIHNPTLYRAGLREQLEHIRKLKDELVTKSPQYLLGVAAFKNEGPLSKYHDTRFENIPTTLNLAKVLVGEVDSQRPLIDGVAVYCDWQATTQDWRQIATW